MISIERVVIKNYKVLKSLDLELNPNLNIIVGDNEVGKSTLIEAIDMALTGRLNGRSIINELSPFMFNRQVVKEYLESLKTSTKTIPHIKIELYFSHSPELARLKGSINSRRDDTYGVSLTIEFDEDYQEEYQQYIKEPDKVQSVPIEYYKVSWLSFANNIVSKRSLPISSTFIDASTIKTQYGSDHYTRQVIENNLTDKERAELSLAYRLLKEDFASKSCFEGINAVSNHHQELLKEKQISLSIDSSNKASWENTITTYLDNIPYMYIGKGTQNIIKVMISLEKRDAETNVILIEEPENHLSFSNMNKLLDLIIDKCAGKQLIISTHSTYVLNKLGMENLILIGENNQTKALKDLDKTTYKYFKKLPGYDTLRLVLSKAAILVEGPSDELVVHKAYLNKYGKLPIKDSIDVISVNGLSFKRFLDIALLVNKKVAVVTDNDGDYRNKVEGKYEEYINKDCIQICYDKDDNYKSLEHQIIKANDLETLNRIFGRTEPDEDSMIMYLTKNKTEAALKLFEIEESITIPEYINQAIDYVC